MMTETVTGGMRPAGVAGTFYPAGTQELTGSISAHLSEAGPTATLPKALLAPHAGYAYSGHIAGQAFSRLPLIDPEAVILVGPSHLEAFREVSIFPGAGYATPLGACALHEGMARALVTDPRAPVRYSNAGHWQAGSVRQEHALEVELPFLQVRLPGAPRIVPLVMGEQSWETVEALGAALARAVRAECDPTRVVLVASSDLSHFHPDREAEQRDATTLGLIETFDPIRFHQALTSGEAEACGGGPIAAVMLAAALLGAASAQVLGYAHSGAVAGDRTSVVGYGAVVFA